MKNDEEAFYSIYRITADNPDLMLESGITVINECGFVFTAFINADTKDGYVSLIDTQLNKTAVNKYCSNFRLYQPF